MGKATNLKVEDIPKSRRGRTVQLDKDMIADLRKVANGQVKNFAPYFEGKDLTNPKVKQAIGQNIRKNWKHADGLGKDSALLRLDFGPGIIAARVRTQAETEAETPSNEG